MSQDKEVQYFIEAKSKAFLHLSFVEVLGAVFFFSVAVESTSCYADQLSVISHFFQKHPVDVFGEHIKLYLDFLTITNSGRACAITDMTHFSHIKH